MTPLTWPATRAAWPSAVATAAAFLLTGLTMSLSACGGGQDDAAAAGADPNTVSSAPASRDTLDLALSSPSAIAEEPLFRFEKGTLLVESADGQSATLLNASAPSVTANAVGTTTTYTTDPGILRLQFQGGTRDQRSAMVIPDPTISTGSNQVLRFWLREANVASGSNAAATKGRIQMNMYDMPPSREVYMRTRLYISDGFRALNKFPRSFDFLTLSEWWNNASWTGQAYPFRISVNITKPAAAVGSGLYFKVRADAMPAAGGAWGDALWEQVNRNINVPVGHWVTLEYHFREGDARTGRFFMAITPEGGARQVIFDIQGVTHHPNDPAPDGITHINPLKLYTAKVLIDQVHLAADAMRLYWDDLTLRLCADSRTPSGCEPPAVSVADPALARR
jgi:hypothetical protein